ncbi:PAS domain S-box protein [Cohnella suwonensis]|uniref:histidine kinase n=1 Tax=Cohnella suwonensis TaxID=696072 RepID=A0ABW0LYQ9_9BACL
MNINNPYNRDGYKMLVLDSILNLSSDAIYVIDLQGKVLEANKRFEELHGWKRGEVIGREIPQTPQDRIEARDYFNRILQGEQVTVMEALKTTKSGSTFYADVTVAQVHDESGWLIGFVIIERDITDRKKADERLRQSEERYRVLVECSPEPIVVYQNSAIAFVNPAAVKLIGADSADQLIGLHVTPFLHPDDIDGLYDILNGAKEGQSHERRLIRTDGEVLYVELQAVSIDFLGIPSTQLLFRDMTDRKRAELELAAREKEFSRILKLSPEPILLYRAGKVTFVNDQAIRLLRGTSDADFVGLSMIGFFCESNYSIIKERMDKVIQSDGYMEFIDLKLKPIVGDLIDVEVSSICVHRNGLDSVVQVVIRDLTERKKTEDIIRRSDKLSIAGELAAGVAHEIRNPLTALRGFMQLLKAKDTEYVDIMLMEIDRISYIVNEFIGLAKPQALHFVQSDLRSLIGSVIQFMQPQALLYNVDMRMSAEWPIASVMCEPNQIKQVFMNVLKNAIEAMPNGGQIEVVVSMDPDGNAITRISDEGVGIPQDRLERIGEPFFSLKESGTGLGLMVCHRIIEAHRGQLVISSIVNVGTTLEILLPTVMSH